MRYSERFRVEPGSKLELADRDPGFKDRHEDKASAEGEIAAFAGRLRELQYLIYAEDRRSVLVCLQALDAGGKDGVINHVLGAMNPQGTRVHAFKVPSREEASHDFLWRAHLHAPARGEVVIFNRSHY
jgi:polyphosphate kinase 2 (PPK2 family)